MNKPNIKTQIRLCKQASSLLHLGMPIIKSLQISGFPNQVIEMMLKGRMLSESAKGYLNGSVINLLKMGEMTGEIDNSLFLAAQEMERHEELRKKIFKSLFYPATVLLMSFATVIFFLLYLIPQLKSIFESMDLSLPANVILLINVSHYLVPSFIVSAVIIIIFMRLFNKDYFILEREAIKYNFPVSGRIARKLINAKLLRQIAMYLKAGFPLSQSIEEAAASCGSKLFEQALFRIKEDLTNGEKLSYAVSKEKLIDSLLVQLLIVAEESGQIINILEEASLLCEEDAKNSISHATLLIEPFSTVIVGCVVGCIIFVMFSPMLKIINYLE